MSIEKTVDEILALHDYVLEYSPSQEAFHIMRRQEMLTENLDIVLRLDEGKTAPGYIPIFIGKYEKCREARDMVAKTMNRVRESRGNYENSNLPPVGHAEQDHPDRA